MKPLVSSLNSSTPNDTFSPTPMLYNMTYGLELEKTATDVLIVFFVLIIITTLVGNIFLVSVIILVRKLHSITHVFIINLAIGDILIATMVMPFDLDQLIKRHFAHDVITCNLTNTIFLLSLPGSALNLCLLTIERYLTLRFPLSRMRLFTKGRIITVLICSWLYTTVTATLPLMGWRPLKTEVVHGQCRFYFERGYAIFMLACNFFFPLLIILVVNIQIFSIANHHAKRLQSTTLNQRRRVSMISVGANIKAAKRILLLVSLFLLCWLTYIIMVIVNIICNSCIPREIVWTVNILNYSNSAMNPILYGLLNKEIRNVVKLRFRQTALKFSTRSSGYKYKPSTAVNGSISRGKRECESNEDVQESAL